MSEENKLKMKLDIANRHIEYLRDKLININDDGDFCHCGTCANEKFVNKLNEAQDNYHKCIDLIERGYHE